jgi:hypothetical protein
LNCIWEILLGRKRFFLIPVFIILLFSLILGGVAAATMWIKTYGGTGVEYDWDMIETSDGGYAIIGETSSFGAGDLDFWLVKTDSAGNELWNQTYGGISGDGGDSVVETSDGGYAIAGQTGSYGVGARDFWLVKTDNKGNIEWNQTYGGTSNDICFSFAETKDSGFALAGHTQSFDGGDWNIWLVKTDADGNAQWNQTYGGTNTYSGGYLVETSDGGYAIAGYTFVDYFNPDFLLIKTDESGIVPEFSSNTMLLILVMTTATIIISVKKLKKKE